ncbi:Shedu anti-phage system protein SduA domain-containing protein [Bradyrhizobium sp. BRP56]|uniref:Shedu anti-phage system protein SduA domain-containing protein n=1 Tax=Bradyrhizobium sp. BRP56 TaxID=2793819 RepID=UPI001CD39378|nr:DUF4263 domain-containing protein [Bradyrhizobium sp. BRP56]
MNYFDTFYALLQDAITDGGLAARNRVEVEARAADELAITFPAYAALTTWGRKGFEVIVDIAIKGRTVKSKSAALTLFTVLGASGRLSVNQLLMTNPRFIALVNSKFDATTTKPAARYALRSLVMSLPTDDLLIPLSQSFMHLQLQPEEPAPELVQHLVGAISAKWLRFGPPALDRYEHMLTARANDEPAFQEFFCTYPQLLDPLAVQVWSQPDFHGAAEPDFVIRRADDSYLVVEIECPGKMLLTKGGQFSHETVHAEKQTLDYESFLSERVVEARMHFPNYRRADCLAVIGLETALTTEQRQNLDRANGRRQNLRVVGFDWLLDRARTMISNIGEGEIEVIKRHRVV